MKLFRDILVLSAFLFCSCLLMPVDGFAAENRTTLFQSVAQALQHSPELQALQFDQKALQHELKGARGRYLPTIDLSLGYGYEQYNDELTRKLGADPSEDDWDTLGKANLKLVQNLYKGGANVTRVAIQQALLTSSNYQLQAMAQEIALNAVEAHLDVYRLRQLVALAENNLGVHQQIRESLSEREQAGAGSIADVTLASARMARAAAQLAQLREELEHKVAAYRRVVGVSPGALGFAILPEQMPDDLDALQTKVRASNPELQALEAEVAQAESRIRLNRSSYLPTLDLELNSDYSDQLEGSRTWQMTNEAMLKLTWNLFNGGQDKSAVNASLERKLQTLSTRKARQEELAEEAAVAWNQSLSLARQKKIYQEAVNFSRETFEAYLKQFTVSQRSLLDVLSAEDDYFQVSRQLVNVINREIYTSYQLQALMGSCLPPEGLGREPDDLSQPDEPLLNLADAATVEPDAVVAEQPQENIPAFVDRWLKAWKNQQLADYFACYSDNFMPEDEMTLLDWQDQREMRLKTPLYIDITVSDLTIEALSENVVRVGFEQDYSSDIYTDRVEKSLLLERDDLGWKIVRERSRSLF